MMKAPIDFVDWFGEHDYDGDPTDFGPGTDTRAAFDLGRLYERDATLAALKRLGDVSDSETLRACISILSELQR